MSLNMKENYKLHLREAPFNISQSQWYLVVLLFNWSSSSSSSSSISISSSSSISSTSSSSSISSSSSSFQRAALMGLVT